MVGQYSLTLGTILSKLNHALTQFYDFVTILWTDVSLRNDRSIGVVSLTLTLKFPQNKESTYEKVPFTWAYLFKS